MGPSAAGKSTLVKMLVGYIIRKQGMFTIMMLMAMILRLEELRKQIGFVTQDTQLFAGTIKENLLFVNPSATGIRR